MTYFIIGIRRSGLHAIANWLFPMMGEYIYLNNYKLGNLSDKELVIKGNFNVLIGIENKPLEEIEKYCKGIKIWVRRNFEDVEKSQRKWYTDAGLSTIEINYKINQAKKLYSQYPKGIQYESWNTSVNYRKQLAESLGLTFNDSNKEKIFGYGQSSFHISSR